MGRLMVLLADDELGVGGKRCGVAAPAALVADRHAVDAGAVRVAVRNSSTSAWVGACGVHPT